MQEADACFYLFCKDVDVPTPAALSVTFAYFLSGTGSTVPSVRVISETADGLDEKRVYHEAGVDPQENVTVFFSSFEIDSVELNSRRLRYERPCTGSGILSQCKESNSLPENDIHGSIRKS